MLANYTTYDTYFRIGKAIRDDPEYKVPKARAAIARFLTLHPHNLVQKAEIIVEQFREHTRAKIGGKAKAMVVTSSRLHAVRYKLVLDTYIAGKGYDDIHTLVAFSGTVLDRGDEFTESRIVKRSRKVRHFALSKSAPPALEVGWCPPVRRSRGATEPERRVRRRGRVRGGGSFCL